MLPFAGTRRKPAPFFAMLRQVFEAVRQMLFLSRDVEQNKEEIAALKEQLGETNDLPPQRKPPKGPK